MKSVENGLSRNWVSASGVRSSEKLDPFLLLSQVQIKYKKKKKNCFPKYSFIFLM